MIMIIIMISQHEIAKLSCFNVCFVAFIFHHACVDLPSLSSPWKWFTSVYSSFVFKVKKKKKLLTGLLRDFDPILHCKLFQLVQIVYFVSTAICFEHLLQILSGAEVWPQCRSLQALGDLVLALGHYLVARPSDDLKRD